MYTIESQRPTIFDLFAGAGGLSLGAARAGFSVICAAELDEKALDTHMRNFPNTRHLKVNLSTIDAKKLRELTGLKRKELTGLIGGPPCQGFSFIGRRNAEDLRNNLFVRFFEFVDEFQPAFFVAENVPGILDKRYDEIRSKAFGQISQYTMLSPMTFKASDLGVPTSRTRVFFIGYDPHRISNLNEALFQCLQVPEHLQIHVKEALRGLPLDVSSFQNGMAQASCQCMQTSEFHVKLQGDIPDGVGDQDSISSYFSKKVITGCFPTKHSAKVQNRYSSLQYGQQDSISKSIKLNPDGFCPTLRAGTGPEKGSFQAVRPIHYAVPRVITPREAARLQGFPDWFSFQPTIWHSFRQIGNSVSPIVAEKILSVIYQKLT